MAVVRRWSFFWDLPLIDHQVSHLVLDLGEYSIATVKLLLWARGERNTRKLSIKKKETVHLSMVHHGGQTLFEIPGAYSVICSHLQDTFRWKL